MDRKFFEYDYDSISLTIPTPEGLKVVALLFLAGLALTAFLGILKLLHDKPSWFGRFRLAKKRGLNALGWLAIILSPIWLALLVLTILNLFALFASPPSTEPEQALAYRVHYLAVVGLMTALAGLVGTPLALIRVFTTERQTLTAEQGHITDQINKAVENLGATRNVKDSEENETTEPNLEVRIGGILALERIGKQNPSEHIQIMEILCAYIRENSRVSDAQESPHEVATKLGEGDAHRAPMNYAQIDEHPNYRSVNNIDANPDELNADNNRFWVSLLPHIREDVQIALTVIGRRPDRNIAIELQLDAPFEIDLRRCNLQRANLTGNFSKANFSKSKFDGANFQGDFRECNFWFCSFQSSSASFLLSGGCNFSGSNLSYSSWIDCDLTRSCLCRTRQISTTFNGSDMRFSDWYNAQPKRVFFHDTDASFGRFQNVNIEQLRGIEAGPTQSICAPEDEYIPPSIARMKVAPKSKSEIDLRFAWQKKLRLLGFSGPAYNRRTND